MKSLGSKASGARLERMRASPRWTGEGFRNLHPILPGLRDPNASMPSFGDFLCGPERGSPARPLPSLNPLDTWRRKPDTELRATWLGHSTTLIEIGGVRVRDRPRLGIACFAAVTRRPRSASSLCPSPWRDMPPVDLVIISHDHYDHLDYPTIRALVKSDLPFVTSLGVGAHLEAWGIPPHRITELDWWEIVRSYRRPASALPRRPHSIFRVAPSRPATQLSGPPSSCARSAIASSSAATQASRRSTRTSASDLGRSTSPCSKSAHGDPAWGDMHLGPDNALEAVAMLDAETFLPIHWGTFRLCDACVGPTRRGSVRAEFENPHATAHAETRGTRGTGACFRQGRTVVAKR